MYRKLEPGFVSDANNLTSILPAILMNGKHVYICMQLVGLNIGEWTGIIEHCLN